MKENFLCSKKSYVCSSKNRPAFSLVEMLMALLVASLLLAALAPVITRKMDDSMTVSIEGTLPGKKTKTHTIEYGSAECSNVKTDTDGSQYCEGEFIVPVGYNGDMKITVVGAGGGGGAAPSAGYKEYTTPGSTGTFTVPAMVNQIEATLVSGGAGGGAGGQILTNIDYLAPGEFTWNVPNVTKNKNILVTACGGGGGGGGYASGGTLYISATGSGNGGGGGYILNKVITLNNAASQNIIIGGGGGGGGAFTSIENARGLNGSSGAGGGGGGDKWADAGGTGGFGGSNGGAGGISRESSSYFGWGGERGDIKLTSNVDGQNGVIGKDTDGGTGGGAGNGGAAKWLTLLDSNGISIPHGQGGGGGGGSITGYGGGGGGGGCGGAGGGGGGGATIFGTRNNSLAVAPGGGGGGGGAIDDVDFANNKRLEIGAPGGSARTHAGGGGGGGGGGNGGGNGGTGGRAAVTQAGSGTNGTGYQSSTIFGSYHCSGGAGYQNYAINWQNYVQKGKNGKPGAMRITYLNYGPGGGGGGSGQIVPIQSVNVAEKEVLHISVGAGASGGKAGKIDSSNEIIKPTAGKGFNTKTENTTYVSKILNDTDNTLLTSTPLVNGNLTSVGAYGGSPDGVSYVTSSPYYAAYGAITTGNNNSVKYLAVNGFSNTAGHSANNGTKTYAEGATSFANETTGGDGGAATIFGNITCTPGKGGTLSNPKGGNASGYGCGGGGGYGLADGGNGSGGYVRISWNKYWDAAKSIYKYAETGTAGGGASGNVMTYTIQGAKSGDIIKIRIGKGGAGAYINNNELIPAKNGGNTIFGYGTTNKIVSAGGGAAGGSASADSNANSLVSGKGGNTSNICKGINNKDYLNIQCTASLTTNCCIQGTKGEDGINGSNANNKLSAGGNGGTLNKYGAGGNGGTTGDNANGKNADAAGYGAGGGGAGILEVGTPSVSTYNPNTGGNSSNGKILIEWWE